MKSSNDLINWEKIVKEYKIQISNKFTNQLDWFNLLNIIDNFKYMHTIANNLNWQNTNEFLYKCLQILNSYSNCEFNYSQFKSKIEGILFSKTNPFYYHLFIYLMDMPLMVEFPFKEHLSKLHIPNINKLTQGVTMSQEKEIPEKDVPEESIHKRKFPTEEKPSKLSKILTKTQSHSLEIAKRTAAKKIAKGATKPIITILKALKVENPFIFSMLETEQGIAFVGAAIGLLAPWLPIPNQKIKKLINTLSDELQIQGGQAVFEPLVNMFLGPFMNEFSKVIEPILGQKEIKQLVGIPFSTKKESQKKEPVLKKRTKAKKQNKEILVKEIVNEV